MAIHMKVLDTSFIISIFLIEDENHPKAVAIFNNHNNEELLLLDTILFETLSLLNRRKGMDEAREVHGKLLACSKLHMHYLSDAQRKEVVKAFLEQKGRLSPADISVILACKTALAAPLAFDKEIVKRVQV